MSSQLPSGFIDSLRSAGLPDPNSLAAALTDTDPIVAVRANPLKGAMPAAGADSPAWEPLGFYLPRRPLFVADPAWHQGLYYVQDASSMILGEAVRRILPLHEPTGRPLRYLDACAAPGGKTISAIDALPPDAFVVANEADRHRANILTENLARHGAPNVAVTIGPAQAYSRCPEAFDIIAADVPCSGEGMMRKDPEAVAQWSPALVRDCAALQRDILDALWTALRPGGFLIYSTCTFNRAENEDNILYTISQLGASTIDLGLDAFAGVVPSVDGAVHAARFLPGRVRGEGLFIAVLQKSADGSRARQSKSRKSAKKPRPAVADAFATSVLACPSDFSLIGTDTISAVTTAHADFAAEIASTVATLRCGLPIAQTKGRDLVPTHELVMSTALRHDAFPQLDLAYPQAIAYLRGEALTDIPDGTPRGIIVVTYAGIPLGLAKNIGRRANNLYPDYLRLRMVLPEPLQAPEPLVAIQRC